MPTECGMTVVEAARELGVRTDEIYRLIYAGRLDATKHEDGRWCIQQASVRAHKRRTRKVPSGR